MGRIVTIGFYVCGICPLGVCRHIGIKGGKAWQLGSVSAQSANTSGVDRAQYHSIANRCRAKARQASDWLPTKPVCTAHLLLIDW